MKKQKIAIIGHGIVGKAFEKMIASFYQIIVYDPLENKVYPEDEINKCDLAVICVPTNANKDGSCDVSIVEKMVNKIKSKYILIKSTVEPGTVDKLVKKTKKKICFSPEYIGESSYYHPYWKEMVETPFLIVGGDDEISSYVIELLEPVLGPTKQYFKCKALEAEIIKYMENSFFATKVTFVNEFFSICQAFGADWHTVREGWLLDSRINKMHTSVFKDKRGFGGKCYPKDLSAIISSSIKNGYQPKLLEQVKRSNKAFRKIN
jgi:UDPglucose 6-dehydrogenase